MLRVANKAESSLQYVPLKQINIQSTIRSFAADVTITQIFRNDESTTIEAVYCFPIEEQAAIYKFTARIDNRKINAQLKEKHHEQIEYHSDFEQQYQTYRLEQDEKSQDIFFIDVGILPPSKECLITISYVTELDLIQGSIIRFVIPTTIVPRYDPKKKSSTLSTNIKSKYVQTKLYIIEFRCRIEKLYGPNQEQYIAQLTSPSHRIDVDLSLHDAYIVTFVEQNTYLDRDIILDVKLSDIRANTFIIVESGAVMAAVTPFEEDCYLTLDNNQTNEFIFIIDCSGSMKNQNKFGLAREAMLFFVEHLPKNCYFNIIKFGAKYNCLFNESTVIYNDVHRRIAEKFISDIQADFGGTELLAPLQWLERHPPRSDRARQIFLLTDGQVANVSEILELCRSMASSTRIFSFGLGGSPSRSLIKGLARTTNGRFVFIPPNNRIDIYVKEQLQKAIQRCITNIRIQWNLGVSIETVPNVLSPAYLNDRLIIYALTENQRIELNRKSSIEIRTDQSYYRLGITNSDRITNDHSQMIGRLAAKALILELEHSKIFRKGAKRVRFEDTKQRIINLSLRYNILSPYTVFIGMEKHLDSNHTEKMSREIRIEISRNNQEFNSTNSRSHKTLSDIYDSHSYSSIRSFERSRGNSLSTLLRTSTHDKYKNDDSEEHDLLKHVQSCHYTSTSMPLSTTTTEENSSLILFDKNELFTMNDNDLVDYLIREQKSDDLWNFDSNRKTIKYLTGKPFTIFQSSEISDNIQILITAIVIILFEIRFKNYRSLWYDAVEKARQRLINLLNNDWKKLVLLFRYIRMILDE